MPKPAPPKAQPLQRLLDGDNALAPHEIDALYGLEPLLEPDANHAQLDTDRLIRCPHCAQSYAVRLDLTAGSQQTLTEDCAICCRPLQIAFQVSSSGALRDLHVSRLDGSDT